MLADSFSNTSNTCPRRPLRWGRSANVKGQGGKIWSGETGKPWHSQHVSSNSSLPGPARLIHLRLRVQMGTYRDLIFTLFFKWVLHDLIHTWRISLTPSLAPNSPPSLSLSLNEVFRYSESREDIRELKIYFLIHTCHPHACETLSPSSRSHIDYPSECFHIKVQSSEIKATCELRY